MPTARHAAAATLLLAATGAWAQTPPADASASYSVSAARATDEALVLRAQQVLRDKGFDSGALDGQWGQGMLGALQRFQESKGLPVTGQLDDHTLAVLGIGGSPDAHAAVGAGLPTPPRPVLPPPEPPPEAARAEPTLASPPPAQDAAPGPFPDERRTPEPGFFRSENGV